jgi:hypothetical protein
MKTLVALLSLGAVVGCMLLSGCSKPRSPAAHPENSGDASAAASAEDKDPVEMKIKWNVGKQYEMRIQVNQATETVVANVANPVKQSVKVAQDFNISPKKVLDNGGWQLELTFLNQSMDVFQGDNKVLSFDSMQGVPVDTNNLAAVILQAMIGARIEYFTDANGKVERIEGVDDLMNRFSSNGKPQGRAMFRQMFSEDTLKRYGSFGDQFPNRLVKVGESWSNQEDINSGIGVLALDVKSTFKNWEQYADHRCAHIEIKGAITSKTTSNGSGALVEIEKGKITGDFWFDPELGMIVGANDDEDMQIKVTTQAQSMKPHLTQKVRLTLVDVQ